MGCAAFTRTKYSDRQQRIKQCAASLACLAWLRCLAFCILKIIPTLYRTCLCMRLFVWRVKLFPQLMHALGSGPSVCPCFLKRFQCFKQNPIPKCFRSHPATEQHFLTGASVDPVALNLSRCSLHNPWPLYFPSQLKTPHELIGFCMPPL